MPNSAMRLHFLPKLRALAGELQQQLI